MPDVRICVVSDIDCATVAVGSSESIGQIASMLVEDGATVHLLVTGVHRAGVIRVPIGSIARYSRRYSTIELRATMRIGGHFYSTDWRRWAERAARLFGRRAARRWLAPPPAHALDWAARRIRALAPDLVMANYFNVMPVFERLDPGMPAALDLHDIVALRAESFAEGGVAVDFDAALLHVEAAVLRRPGLLLLAIKDAEADYVRAQVPGADVITVPMVVDVATGAGDDAPAEPVAIFVGASFAANAEALRWLLHEVWPRVIAARPAARLRVIGTVAGTPGLTWPAGAEPVGFVDDLAAEYRAARVALAPMRVGSGLKIKAVEALGFGVPVVATRCGADGMEGAADAVLRVADSPDAYAQAVIAALDAPDQPAVRRATRDYAGTRFSRATVGRRLNAAITRMVRR